MFLPKRFQRCRKRGYIARKRRPLRRRIVEIDRAVVALLVSAGDAMQQPISACDAFTGHQNGLIGQTTSTGARPSHPASRSALRPYSAGAAQTSTPCPSPVRSALPVRSAPPAIPDCA